MKHLVTISAALMALAGSGFAADSYPSKPIRLIMPQSAGSSNDTVGRIVAARMSQLLGQQVVVDNRAGAVGIIGAEIGARAVPDGYTLLSGSAPTQAVATIMYKKLPYDPIKDFAPISLMGISNVVFCVTPSLPARDVKEFIALAKSKPGALNMASAGVGSASHLAGLMFVALADIKSVHVPYKGGGESPTAVSSGEAQWTISPAGALMTHIRAGRLRALAVGGVKRATSLPDVPTIAEAGLPGYAFFSWSGLFAPAGTPRPIIDKLHQVTSEALATPEVREQLLRQGVEPEASPSPEAFARFVAEEQQRMRKLAPLAGITPQ
jgi:tripartite-type tricarboxylate transporter receptor subunit TctC